MFRKLAAATGLIGLMAASAYAADPVMPSGHDWSGAYVGVNGGYAFGNQVQSDATGYDSGNQDLDGFAGGAQLGFNYQTDSFVLGAETDFQFTGMDNNFETQVNQWNCGPDNDCSTQVSWFGTSRLRLGYALDNIMPYVTGGLAYGSVESEIAGGGSDWKLDETQIGWTAGGGVEMAFTENFSGRLEYLYVDLGETGSVGAYDFSASAKFSTVRAGLNYAF